MAIDWKGLNPAPVTLFKDNGDVDFEANARLAKWLASIDGVKSLVILGHAGEGTFLTHDEQLELIRVYKDATSLPVVAGITGEGTRVAEQEAKEKYDAGASAALVYPNHGWLRFGSPEGRAEVPLRGGRPVRPRVHPVPVPGRDQGQLRPRHPARDLRDRGRHRHQERRARHEALVQRDPGDQERLPGDRGDVLP